MSTTPAKPVSLEELADDALVTLFLERGRRDDRPFAELFRRHRNHVWGVCLGFFGNSQDAEDIAQDVFFAAYRKLGQFRGEASFRTWLHRIAANLCKNEIRRRSRRIKTADVGFEIAAEVPSTGEDAEVLAIRSGAAARLDAALASLRSEDRAILQRVDIEEEPYKEVATELGLSMGAVKMRVMRARLALRDAIRAQQEEGTQ
jgi:RNA polymerase sigma-70 factor (ECF subfamily)